MSGRMVKTWLTGSRRRGLRRRALTRGSVMSESLDNSGVSDAKSGEASGGLGVVFFTMKFLTLFRETARPLLSNRIGWQLYAG